MLESLRKLLLAGLGTLDLTEEKLRAVFDELVSRGEVSEKEARELIADWSRRAGEQKTKLQDQLEDTVRKVMDRVGVVRKADVDALHERISELERRLQDQAKS